MRIIEISKDFFNKKSIYWAANYPKAWSLGWLTQLMIGAVIYTLALIIAVLIPMDTMNTPKVDDWFAFGFIPAFFWWIFIGYRLVKYNSEKLFGNRSWFHNALELPTYILQFFMPIGIPLILGFVLMFRVGGLVEDKQLDNCKMTYEEAEPFFTFDFRAGHFTNYFLKGEKYQFEFDSYVFQVFDTTEGYRYNDFFDEYRYFENDSVFLKKFQENWDYDDDYVSYGKTQDEIEFVKEKIRDSLYYYRIDMKDSIVRHLGVFKNQRPQLYPSIFYQFSDHYYNKHSWREEYSHGASWLMKYDSLQQVYFFNHYKDETFVKEKLENLFSNIVELGALKENSLTADELMDLFANQIYNAVGNEPLYHKIVSFDSSLDQYVDQINYIQRCKNGNFHFSNDSDFYFILLSIIFSLALILAVFKNTGWKEFLVGFFIIPLIPILSGIFMAIFRTDKETVFFIFWLQFLILLVWSFIEKQKNTRRKRGAILLSFPHLLLAFIPFAVLLTLDEVFHFWAWDYFDKYLIPFPTEYNPNNMGYNSEYYEMKRESIPFALSVGYFLYLFILYPLWIKPDWMRFIAKPTRT